MIVGYDTIEKWDGLIVTYNNDSWKQGNFKIPVV